MKLVELEQVMEMEKVKETVIQFHRLPEQTIVHHFHTKIWLFIELFPLKLNFTVENSFWPEEQV